MKPRRLYVRIFLSFLGVLLVTELLIFFLVIGIPARRFSQHMERFAREKAMVVQSLAEEVIQAHPQTPLAENVRLKEFIITFSRLLEAKLWISDGQDAIVVTSFTGPIPRLDGNTAKHRIITTDHFQFSKNRHMEFYAVIPFFYSRLQQGKIHVLFENRGHPPPLGFFAVGLILVGLVVALLVIPVSRPITRRINQLQQSTLRIAEGDLGHRVTTAGGDEIAELGNSFNQMTAKLESMITNSKELTANISHELRTPLARIRVSEELLRGKLAQDSQVSLVRHLDDIREDIDSLDVLVGRILELSKLEMRAAPMVFTPLNLTDLVSEIVEKYRPGMTQRQLKLAIDLPQQIPVTGNHEALSTAFSNLLDNAVSYTANNGTIRIETASKDSDLGIVLSNTCSTLTEAELSAIFNPFQRAHPPGAAGTRTPGSGLGLAIVKKIIEAHGGSIHAHNSPHGLAFSIYLP